MNASSLQDGAGRKGPEREALSVKGRRQRKGKSPAGMPRQRPIGRNAHYEESFLTAQQVICRCREKSDEPFLAAQVIILQQLMQSKRWRRADLVFHSGLKRGIVSLVLRVECFPSTRFWIKAARCLGFTVPEFDQLAQDYLMSENLVS
jgi:hypothetical protein